MKLQWIVGVIFHETDSYIRLCIDKRIRYKHRRDDYWHSWTSLDWKLCFICAARRFVDDLQRVQSIVLYSIASFCVLFYCIVQYLLYCTVLYCIYNFVFYSVVLYCIFSFLYFIVLCFTVLYCIVLCSIVLHCILLHCTILYLHYCILLYCILQVLYCIVLYSIPSTVRIVCTVCEVFVFS
jgi:hypothetical protein